jgi:uncharacterized membrane protein YphA (DoxX/SURF4 family)
MSTWFAHPYSVLLTRLVLGWVFLVSGHGKAQEREQTVHLVVAYQILPEPAARLYGYLLPWIELSLAGLLLVGLWSRLAALVLCLLLASFAIAVSVNLQRGRNMDCGCFGRAGREKLSWRTLVRVVFLFGLSALVVAWDSGYYSLAGLLTLESQVTPVPSLVGFLPLLVLATLAYLGYRMFDEAALTLFDHQRLKGEVITIVNAKMDQINNE